MKQHSLKRMVKKKDVSRSEPLFTSFSDLDLLKPADISFHSETVPLLNLRSLSSAGGGGGESMKGLFTLKHTFRKSFVVQEGWILQCLSSLIQDKKVPVAFSPCYQIFKQLQELLGKNINTLSRA